MSARVNTQAVYMHPKSIMPVDSGTLRRILFFLCVVALITWSVIELRKPETLPIKKIHALGTFNKVDESMLRNVVAKTIDGGYFAVNVTNVKKAVEELPWVDNVSVSRIWPDTLSINVKEQQAAAIWAKGGLVNKHGVVFVPKQESYPEMLPVFDGPIGMQRNMTEFYMQAKAIIDPIGLSITHLNFDSRGAINLRLSNGITVLLGREKTTNRLDRFARVYQKVLIKKASAIANIDMRYSNGLAVGWHKAEKI